MSMAIKGLYSSDWLYTQTPLPWISFLQPWHCWHHFPSPLHLRWKEAKTNTKETRRNGAVRQQRNTKGGKKRGTSDIFILLECSCLAPLVAIWKGLVRRHKHQTMKKKRKEKPFSMMGLDAVWKLSQRQFSSPNISSQSLSSYISISCCRPFRFLVFHCLISGSLRQIRMESK